MPSAAQGITSRTGTTLSSEDGATRGSRGQGNRANRQRGVSGCLRRNSRSPGTYGPTDIVADSPPKSGPGFAHFERGIAPIFFHLRGSFGFVRAANRVGVRDA